MFRATAKSKEQISTKRNYYDTTAYYFLSDSAPETDISTHPLNTSAGSSMAVYDWSYEISVIENEVQNPGKGSVYFHDRKLSPGESQTFDFHIRNYKNVEGIATNGFFQYEGALLTPAAVSASQLQYAGQWPKHHQKHGNIQKHIGHRTLYTH